MNLGELIITLKVDATNMEVLDAEIKKVEKTADKSFGKVEDAADAAEEGIGGLVATATELAPVFAVAAGAAALMVDWFMKTEAGADAAAYATKFLGEMMDSAMTGKGADFGGALKVAEEENRLRAQARIDMVNQAALSAQIRGHRLDVYDAEASIADKIKAQKAALEDQKKLEEAITSGLYEQLALVEAKLARNPIHTKSLNEQAALEKQILDIQNSGSLLMQKTLSSLEKQQTRQTEAYKKSLEELFTPETEKIMRDYAYALEDISTWASIFGETTQTNEQRLDLYTSTLKELIASGLTPADAEVQKMVRSIKELNDQLKTEDLKAWVEATMLIDQYRPGNEALKGISSMDKFGSLEGEQKGVFFSDPRDLSDPGWRMKEAAKTADESMRLTMGVVNQLDSTFQTMFTNLGGGFEGMITALLDSLRLLIVELTAKAAIFGILTLLSGGTSKLAMGAGKLIKGGFMDFFLGGNKFAGGTDYAPGGMALVGERGPELINLPKGSQVIPNHLAGAALGGGQVVFEIEGTKLVGVLQNQTRKSNSFR